MAESAQYARDRLDQDFNLPGRPARRSILMPDRIAPKFIVQLVERRVRSALGDFDPTGLPPNFPFAESQLRQLEGEATIRNCLRRLSGWFDALQGVPCATVPGTSGRAYSSSGVR